MPQLKEGSNGFVSRCEVLRLRLAVVLTIAVTGEVVRLQLRVHPRLIPIILMTIFLQMITIILMVKHLSVVG